MIMYFHLKSPSYLNEESLNAKLGPECLIHVFKVSIVEGTQLLFTLFQSLVAVEVYGIQHTSCVTDALPDFHGGWLAMIGIRTGVKVLEYLIQTWFVQLKNKNSFFIHQFSDALD